MPADRRARRLYPPAASPAAPPLRWRGLAAAATALLILTKAGFADAASTTERAGQKQAAEAERDALRQKLAALKRDIHQTEAAKDHAADILADSETAISEANLTLRELAL